MRLSFKKNPKATGLAGIAEPKPSTTIKGDGKDIGYIRPPHFSDNNYKWRVYFRVKKEATPKSPAAWYNAKVIKEFDTEPEAREYLKANWEKFSKENIHKMD